MKAQQGCQIAFVPLDIAWIDMMRWPIYASAIIIIMEAQTPRAFAQAVDIDKGRELAERLCSRCHNPEDQLGRDYQGHYVPTFKQVANTPHYSIVRLRRIMAVPPHTEMPKLPLKLDEIDNIAAYINSLRK